MRDKTGQSNAIVFRLVAGTLRESVFSQIQWAIDTLGVSHLWKSKVSPMQFEYVNGAQIIFRGLDDALKLKSIKPKKGSFAFIWLEEFSELPGELLLRSVQQSVMRGRDDFIVFRSFNPPISANYGLDPVIFRRGHSQEMALLILHQGRIIIIILRKILLKG